MRALVRLAVSKSIATYSATHAAEAATVTFVVSPTIIPSVRPVSLSFPGFAFEQAAFYNHSFTASGQPNTFSGNLIARAGPSPAIRVGETSGARAHFNASQDTATNYPASDFSVRFDAPFLGIGRPYFDAFENSMTLERTISSKFPGTERRCGGSRRRATRMVWLGLEPGWRFWERTGWMRRGIGNEPNYYTGITPGDYADRYRNVQSSLLRRLSELQGSRIFQALDIAVAPAATSETKEFFAAGLSEIAPSIKQVALHYHQGTGVRAWGSCRAGSHTLGQ